MILVPFGAITALAAAVYTVSVNPNYTSRGTATSTPTSVAAGGDVTLKATAYAGFEFSHWETGSGGSFTDDTNPNAVYTTPTPGRVVYITAVFEIDTGYEFTISTSVNNSSGGTASVSIPLSSKAAADDTVTLNAVPKTGYYFYRWEVVSGSVTFANAGSATTTFTMPNSNVSVRAIFYNIGYNGYYGDPYYGYGYGYNGYWSGGYWYDGYGNYYNPSTGYWSNGVYDPYFNYYGYGYGYDYGYGYGYGYNGYWSGGYWYDGYGNYYNPSTGYWSNGVYDPNFNYYGYGYGTGYYGDGYWGSNGYWYDGYGNYYNPSTGYWSNGVYDPYFDYYGYGYGYGYNGYYGYNRYGVSTSVNNTAWGRATSSSTTGAAYNSTVTLTATPYAGYSFVNWEVLSGNVTLTNANSSTTTFVMPYTSVSVRAVFEKTVTRYAAAASVNNSAWGTASVSSASEPQGAVILLTASANPGYEFSHWEVASGVFVIANPVSPLTSFTMPASNATVNAIFKESDASPAPPPPPAPTPSVNASPWAAAGVARAISLDIVPVQLQSNYTQYITRAEFCALAVAVYEKAMDREITGRVQFDDTDDVNIEKAAAVGIVTGVGDGRFDPYATLTREQAAVILVSLATAIDKPLSMYSAPPPSDFASVSSWAVDAVIQVMGAGIMIGVGGDNFSPGGTCTIEQSIIIMMRLFEMG